MEISGAGEGLVDHAVIRRILIELKARPGPMFGGRGKPDLLSRVAGFNAAARFGPWFVLVDLDNDSDCAPTARAQWLAAPSGKMCFRIAVRSVEAWLLADSERIARFLSVAEAKVPAQPETLPNPKAVLVELARSSRRRDIRDDMVPRQQGGRTVGPAYVSRMIEFISDPSHGWRLQVAARRSESLRRCSDCLLRLVGT
jgi:hypothetical protein